jgi:hypothetical protein
MGVGPHVALLDLTGPTFRRFADAHGYDVHFTQENPAQDRPAPWGKVPLIRKLLELYDLVLWIDADAAIVDPSQDIADELDQHCLMAMTAHETPEGDDPIPNSGVWLLRSDPLTFDFLDTVWQSTEYLNHKWWENAAALAALGYQLEPRIRLTEPTQAWHRTRLLSNQWNSIPIDPADAPRIVHFPGMRLDERLDRLGEAVEASR